MMAHLSGIWILYPPHQLKKKLSNLDPLWQNFLDLRMVYETCMQNENVCKKTELYTIKPPLN